MDDTNAQSSTGPLQGPSPSSGAQPAPAVPRQPYRRQVRHITQEPINDIEPRYVTLNRYETLEQRQRRQPFHTMQGRSGASAEAARSAHPASTGSLTESAGPTGPAADAAAYGGAADTGSLSAGARGARRDRTAPYPRSGADHKHMGVATSDPSYMPAAEPAHRAGGAGAAPINYSRYLETPKPGKTIFAGRGRRKSPARFIPVIAVALIAALIIWFLFLR